MSRSMINEFVEDHKDSNPQNETLPLFHSCNGSSAVQIMTDEELQIRHCKEFNKDLLYFFYGKPAYPVGANNHIIRTDYYCLPVCFVINPEKVAIYDSYPFDSGAFKHNLFKDYIPANSSLERFRLNNTLHSVQEYIKAMFNTNDDYILGNCSLSEYDILEVDALIRMFNATGEIPFDERANTVEIITDKSVPLKDALETVILPNSMLRNRNVQNFLSKSNIEPLEYHVRSTSVAERYYELIFAKALDYIVSRKKR